MKDSNSGRIPFDLLDRYMAGECSTAEVRTVEEWVAAGQDRLDIFNGLRDVRLIQGSLNVEAVDKAWTRFSTSQMPSRRNSSVKESRIYNVSGSSRFSWRSVGIAAAVALFAGTLGGVFSQRFDTKSIKQFATSRQVYSTGKGQRVTVQLIDGSRVTLAPMSQVDLAADFASGGTRTIEVQGAAFFEVTHNPAVPFVVRSGEAEAQVIGTSFSVERYDDAEGVVEISVSQGKVAVRNSSIDNREAVELSSTVLTNGESARVIPGSGVVERVNIDLSENLAWLDGELRFRQLPLREVANVLERWYSVSIVIPDKGLAAQRVTATFGREGITDIVAQLTRALGARYVFDGSKVTILKSL